MNYKTFLLSGGIVAGMVLFAAGGFLPARAADMALSEVGLVEGDVVGSTDSADPDLYIVNAYGQKRLFTNPRIFGLYGHLSYSKVKRLAPDVLDLFPTSGFFMNCEGSLRTVYALNVLSEDNAELRRLNVAEDKLLNDEPDFFKRVFCINNSEQALYQASVQAYNAIAETPAYQRVIIRPVPTTTVLPVVRPRIDKFVPNSGAIGASVTIYGDGFRSRYYLAPATATIYFNGNSVTRVLVQSDEQISFVVPETVQPPLPPCNDAFICAMPFPMKLTPGIYNVTVGVDGSISEPALFTITANDNRGPVIDGVSGPTSLAVGQQGTWTIAAHDPENGQLTYRVSWGDELYYDSSPSAIPGDLYFKQQTTFTHVYNRPGTYTPTFWVHDNVGNVAKTSMSVAVKDSGTYNLPRLEIFSYSPQSGPVGTRVELEVRGYRCVIGEATDGGCGAVQVYFNGSAVTTTGISPGFFAFNVPSYITPCPAGKNVACPEIAQQVVPGTYYLTVSTYGISASDPVKFTVTSNIITRGDCNADGKVDPADQTAINLEIFDGDGNKTVDARGGTYSGDPFGCDANADTIIDAGDVSCVALIYSGQTCGSSPYNYKITINSPNGGEIWTIGSNQTVSWTIGGQLIGGGSLALSLTGGPTYAQINTIPVSANGSVSIVVPSNAIAGDTVQPMKAGLYKLRADLYDSKPCFGLCISPSTAKLLASDTSDGYINVR